MRDKARTGGRGGARLTGADVNARHIEKVNFVVHEIVVIVAVPEARSSTNRASTRTLKPLSVSLQSFHNRSASKRAASPRCVHHSSMACMPARESASRNIIGREERCALIERTGLWIRSRKLFAKQGGAHGATGA